MKLHNNIYLGIGLGLLCSSLAIWAALSFINKDSNTSKSDISSTTIKESTNSMEDDVSTVNTSDSTLISENYNSDNSERVTSTKLNEEKSYTANKSTDSNANSNNKAADNNLQTALITYGEAEEDAAIQESPTIEDKFPKEEKKEYKKPSRSHNDNSGGSNSSGSHTTQYISKEFIILDEHTQSDGSLLYNVGEDITLPDTALVGLKKSGENSGIPIKLSYPKLSETKIDSSSPKTIVVEVLAKEDIIINSINYNKPLFSINIIIR